MGAERQVPRFLDQLLSEAAFTHDRPRGARRHQVAQHPQHVGAAFQVWLGSDVQQGPLHTALLKVQVQRCEPVVHVAGQRRQRVVADLADPVTAHQDLHQAADVAPARHGVLLDAGDRRVLEVVRRGLGPVAHPGQQDRRLEHRDGVGGGGQVAVAARRAHDLHRPAEQLRLVQPVEDGRPLEEAGEPVRNGGRRHRRRRGLPGLRSSCPSARSAGTA